MQVPEFDLLVIGGGPGGYVCALRAAQLGLRTALVERDQLGGICLNWGCIPTKSLLHSADVLRATRQAAEFGVDVESATPNVLAMFARSRSVAKRLENGVRSLLCKAGVTTLKGNAVLQDAHNVLVTGEGPQLARAKQLVLATGGKPRALSGFPTQGDGIWSYREALNPTSVPASMIVIGAGAIGAELATFYQSVGVQVTLVERADHVLPQEDEAVSRVVRDAMMAEGMNIKTAFEITSVTRESGEWRVKGANGAQLSAPVVLVAVGIVGNTEGLGLEKTRVKVSGSRVVTDELCRTHEPGIYAIGDVAGAPWLAHKASHEGVLVAELAAGREPHGLDYTTIAACTFTHPQVASIGLTEAQAKQQARDLRVGVFPFAVNGRAVAAGATRGFVKTVFDGSTGRLLGAHLVGDGVSELINGLSMAMTLESTEEEIMQSVFAHPTASEAIHESVLAAFGRALHI
ncbi:dihydrolipoamide dehydrogenase [Bradyrhizobium yuanmingense]|uniref:Dihydrolipoyl dehydrogenase n=1 Tax=Bradyrhizobium yuanmingense TaxID=108015 RepID=A0A0R3CUB2_9BRAD|nr:dihydrolipoyl dehydrogenase [Bradyrhizobium yuanmingense]KRP98756.1 dihydrolipoamide dehydrogenase [Bradyrhizobium yuanmingense]